MIRRKSEIDCLNRSLNVLSFSSPVLINIYISPASECSELRYIPFSTMHQHPRSSTNTLLEDFIPGILSRHHGTEPELATQAGFYHHLSAKLHERIDGRFRLAILPLLVRGAEMVLNSLGFEELADLLGTIFAALIPRYSVDFMHIQ